MKAHIRTLAALTALAMLVAACGSSPGPAGIAGPGIDFSIGRSIVATVEVLPETVEIPFSDLVATGLSLRVIEVHWVGSPNPLFRAPDLSPDSVIEALAPPGYEYKASGIYTITATYGNADLGYSWWLSIGIRDDGAVVTDTDARAVEQTLRIADQSDGDVDQPGVLLAELAAEWERNLEARDAGIELEQRPLGPMLRAIYSAAGALQPADQTSMSDRFMATPAEERTLPLDPHDLEEFLDDVGSRLEVEWVDVQGIALHRGGLADIYAMSLWFPGVGHSARYVVNHRAGITLVNSLVPAGRDFELVAFRFPSDDDEHFAHERTQLLPATTGFRSNADSEGPIQYFTIDLEGPEPIVTLLSAEDFWVLVSTLEPDFKR